MWAPTTCYVRCKGGRTLDECNGVPDTVCHDQTDCHTLVQDWFGEERHGTRHKCSSNLESGGCTCMCSYGYSKSSLVHDTSKIVIANGRRQAGKELSLTGIVSEKERAKHGVVAEINLHGEYTVSPALETAISRAKAAEAARLGRG